MRTLPILPAIALACLVVVGAIVERFGLVETLWVFPLQRPALALWFLFAGIDAILALFSSLAHFRLLLWMGGLVFFMAGQRAPVLGLAMVSLPIGLWLASRHSQRRVLLVAAGVGLVCLFGHEARFFHWSLSGTLIDWRMSAHLIAIFFLFRLISWTVAVAGRGERVGFTRTMEYFLAPAFWLCPQQTNHLIWERMAETEVTEAERRRAMLWIVRGILHALALTFFAGFALPWLERVYAGGVGAVAWYEWAGIGPALFLLAYLDKSQVSYIAAGYLRLGGRAVEPDFRSPWLARDLLDYWRRFHFWLWEFYLNNIYSPLSVLCVRRLGARGGVIAALLLTFTFGTGIGHYLEYRAPLWLALVLGLGFGFATLAHVALRRWLASPWIGVPVTWLTVFVLYFFAYPAFGLGWEWKEFSAFFGR